MSLIIIFSLLLIFSFSNRVILNNSKLDFNSLSQKVSKGTRANDLKVASSGTVFMSKVFDGSESLTYRLIDCLMFSKSALGTYFFLTSLRSEVKSFNSKGDI